MSRRRLRLMVSSSVYGFRDQLIQIDAVLRRYGYEPVISDLGTVRVGPHQHNFQACRQAVEGCDIFLGIIRGRYGSGQNAPMGLGDDEVSVTHLEIRHAILINKPRLFLVEEEVDTARQLLKDLRSILSRNLFDDRQQLVWPPANAPFRRNSVLDDLRVLDMYEEALQAQTPLPQRQDHWCQRYHDIRDILRFLEAQFKDRKRLVADLQATLAAPQGPGGP